MKTYQTLLLTIVILAVSCNQSAQDVAQEQQKWDEIMAVHDEVMPKMSDINRLSEDLTARVSTPDSIQMEEQKIIRNHIQGLTNAENGMMDWMGNVRQLDDVRAETDHAGVMKYLDEEKKKVDELKQQMLQSIESAETYVKNNK